METLTLQKHALGWLLLPFFASNSKEMASNTKHFNSKEVIYYKFFCHFYTSNLSNKHIC